MRKALRKRIRRSQDGLNIAADVNAVVASGTGGREGSTEASSRQRIRIVQRDGRSTVAEHHDHE